MPAADQRDPKIVGEEPDGVQEDPLLPKAPGEHGVNLIDDEHARAHAAQQPAADLLLPVRRPIDRTRRAERCQQLAVDIPFDRLGRHLHRHHRHGGDPGALVETCGMVAQEFADDLGLAHAGVAVEQQARHAVPRRVGQKVLQAAERDPGLVEVQPPVRPDPGDPLRIGKLRLAAIWRQEVRVVAHDHSSTPRTGSVPGSSSGPATTALDAAARSAAPSDLARRWT